MKVKDPLKVDQREQLQSINLKPPTEMTHKDWEELMGTNQDTYKRVKGRVRRK